MSYKVEITEKAQEETREAIRWIAQYSPEKAALWHFELMEKVDSLENFPARCALAPESETHGKEIRQLIFGKYRILFIIEDETVYVLRVRHQAQDLLKPKEEE
ncbi:MAG TPA: type II toxin-antitoxin system RelE/ParE family toxin [Pyrinomonadaceae bacterium]|nr:type II toxin-antitoxin system RelE/ParE family toxin [Pyrinomonadaceae bacterium]